MLKCCFAASFLSSLFLHEKKNDSLGCRSETSDKKWKNFGGWLVGFDPKFTNLHVQLDQRKMVTLY